jgi:hypothetical protein
MASKYWNPKQVKEFAKQIRTSEIGKAWQFLVPEVRHAVVEAKILAIVRMQDRDSVPMDAIMDLSNMLHEEMGTEI